MVRTALLSGALVFTVVAGPPLAGQQPVVRTAAPAPQPPAGLPPDLDGYVAQVMRAFEVPGLALAVVKDGKVLLARGYGVRKLGEPAPVDAETRFGIASNTKVFTATALGLLVEEGKLAWDQPVIRYLPWFAMYDPFVTRELTIRDLLVHRSGLGLGAGDLLWWPASTYDRKEIAHRLRYIRPLTSFRSAYAYDNVLYSVAGEVIEAVSGRSWEDFVATRILAKVGMTGSDVRYSGAGPGGDVAHPHAKIGGVVRTVTPLSSDNVNPAGGINSSARDMAKWVMVQLDSGRTADGSRLFSPRTTRELWTIVTPIPLGEPPSELAAIRANFNGYALGLNVRDFRGRKMLTHTGGLPGFVSRVTMLPELRLGVVVLTNAESTTAFSVITHHILDHFLGAPPLDYLGIAKRQEAADDARLAAQAKERAARRDSTSKPSLPLERYAGTYTDAWYGEVTIALENGRLVMRFGHTPELTGDLEHWQYDSFIARWRERELRADAFVSFSLNPDGSIERVKMAPVSEEVDFSFDFQDLDLRPVKPATRP
ncbi:MAG TPA: serine hydrolase [Gemmatimonadales bacterium]|jgi:CubicO group peptidase (beta-lactamase class C family)|nr:serine hydrolase [Gemmatimonadales bacterium]